jgi:hypothetical protein
MLKNLMCTGTLMLQLVSKEKMGPEMEVGDQVVVRKPLPR